LVNIPAICNKCGSMFVAPNLIGGNGSVQFTNCALGPCPTCGGTGNIIDGIYDAATNSARLFLSSITKKNDLLKLQVIIERARRENYTSEQLRHSVKDEVPELQSISDCLPKTRMELYAFLGVIFTIITIITTSTFNYFDSKDTINETDINNVVEEAFKQQTVVPNKSIIKNKKMGRNSPCYCGSGKKYKKCCLLIA